MMYTKNTCLGIMVLLSALACAGPALPGGLPTPTPSCAGDYDANGGYHRKGEQYYTVYGGKKYRCVACSGCVPVDTGGNSGSGSSLPLPMGGANNMEQFAQQMAMGLIANMIQSALSGPPDNTAYYQQQAALKAAQKKAEQQKRLAMYQKLSQSETARRQQDMDQLGSMLDVGLPGSVDNASSDDMFAVPDFSGQEGGEFQARNKGAYDNSGLSMLQRLACANYFSKSALDAAKKGDYVHARYLNEQAEKVMSGQRTELKCRCDNVPGALAKPAAVPMPYHDIIGKVQNDVKRLHDIEAELNKIKQKKETLKKKKTKLQAEISKTEKPAAGVGTKTDKNSKDDSLTHEAEKLLAETEKNLAALNDKEHDLAKQKAEIEDELKAIGQKLQASGAGQQQQQ